MAAKKTLEELRASQRERARRWREKYRRKHLERVKEVYGRSNAQKFSVDGVTPGELERYEKRVVQETRNVPLHEVEADPGVMEEQRARMEKFRPPGRGLRRMEPEQRGGHESEGRVEEHAGVDQNSGGVGGMGDRGGGEVGDIAESGGGVEGGLAGGADEAAGLTDEARRLRFQQLKRDLGVVRSQIQVEEEVEVPW